MNKTFIYAVIIGIIICTLPNFGSRKLPDDQYLQKLGEKLFGISLKELQPEITDIKDRWCSNGDGSVIIRFRYENNNPEIFKKFNQLPIKEKFLPIHIPDNFKSAVNGYYKVNLYDESHSNGEIFYSSREVLIFNADTNEGFLYCCYY